MITAHRPPLYKLVWEFRHVCVLVGVTMQKFDVIPQLLVDEEDYLPLAALGRFAAVSPLLSHKVNTRLSSVTTSKSHSPFS